MRAMLKLEFRRLLKNRILYLAFGVNMLIVILQIVSVILPYAGRVTEVLVYPLSVFDRWIGGEGISIYSTLYFTLTPLVAAIPYGGTLTQDYNSGYVKNICIRANKREYLLAKYIVAFSTGMISVIPLVINFLIGAMLLPATIPQPGTPGFTIFETGMLAELAYVHPFVYLFVWLIIDGIVFGLLGSVSLLIGWFSEYAYVAILSPFLLCMVLYGVSRISGLGAIVPFFYLRASQPVDANPIVILGEVILLIGAGALYYYIGSRKEVY